MAYFSCQAVHLTPFDHCCYASSFSGSLASIRSTSAIPNVNSSKRVGINLLYYRLLSDFWLRGTYYLSRCSRMRDPEYCGRLC